MKRVLLDECTPLPLGHFLKGVEILTVEDKGWKGLKNGELVDAAEGEFDVLITADKNLRHQQNLAGRRLAMVELPYNSWPRLRPRIDRIQHAVDTIQPGAYVALQFG